MTTMTITCAGCVSEHEEHSPDCREIGSMCVSGHTGSRVNACDEMSTTLRDGDPFCDVHASAFDFSMQMAVEQQEWEDAHPGEY